MPVRFPPPYVGGYRYWSGEGESRGPEDTAFEDGQDVSKSNYLCARGGEALGLGIPAVPPERGRRTAGGLQGSTEAPVFRSLGP